MASLIYERVHVLLLISTNIHERTNNNDNYPRMKEKIIKCNFLRLLLDSRKIVTEITLNCKLGALLMQLMVDVPHVNKRMQQTNKHAVKVPRTQNMY